MVSVPVEAEECQTARTQEYLSCDKISYGRRMEIKASGPVRQNNKTAFKSFNVSDFKRHEKAHRDERHNEVVLAYCAMKSAEEVKSL